MPRKGIIIFDARVSVVALTITYLFKRTHQGNAIWYIFKFIIADKQFRVF